MTTLLWQAGVRFPRAVLLGSMILVAACAVGLKGLSITADYRVFFSDDNPELLAFEHQEALFYKSDTVVFGLKSAEADGAFSDDMLVAQAWLTEQAWLLPYVQRVDSLTNYQYSFAEGDDLIIEDLVADAANLSSSQRALIRERALGEAEIRNRLVSEDSSAATLVATVQLPDINRRAEIPEVGNAARVVFAEATARWPNLDIKLFGMVPFNQTLSEATVSDLTLLWPASFALMFVVLAWMLKGIRAVAMTAAVIAASVLIAVGLAGWGGLVMSTATAAAPVIIMTLAIAHSVHLFVNFRQNLVRGEALEPALLHSLRVNFRPVSLTSITTIIGFLTLNFSDAPPFQQLGNIVAVGVLAGWWLALWLLPALVMKFGAGRQVNESPQGLAPLGRWVVAQRSWLLPATTLLFMPIMAMLPRNELNDVFREWFAPSNEVRAGMEFALDNFGGLESLHFTLDSGRAGGVTDPAFYSQVDAFGRWLELQPEVAHVSSYLPIIKRMNRVLNGDLAEQYALPENPDLASQYLTIYELSLPYGQSLNNLLDLAKQRARLSATLGRITSKELKLLDARAQVWMAENAPEFVNSVGSGASKMFAELGQRNIRSMLKGTVLALVLISLLLIFALRSLRLGLICMLPNLVPAALGFGLWGLIDGQVNLALSVVMGMTLGIVVDDTIHFLSKYQRGRRELNKTKALAVEYAFATVGRALWVTSVVLVLGFLVLAFSSFAPTADMGLLTAIVIAMALFADFFFLPPLLLWLDSGDE